MAAPFRLSKRSRSASGPGASRRYPMAWTLARIFTAELILPAGIVSAISGLRSRFRGVSTQLLGILNRRCSEEAAVLATELGRTLVAHLVSHARRLGTVRHQELARLQQPYLLLVLEGTHHRGRLEASMQHRGT